MAICGRTRQELLLHWGAKSASGTKWNYDTSLQWHLLEWESHRGLQNACGGLNELYRHGAARPGRLRPRLNQVELPWLPTERAC